MPGKRKRGGLSGGTGDVNPQWFSTSVTQSAADTTTTQAVSSPPGIGLSQSGKSLAMELLKMAVTFDSIGALYGSLPGAGTAGTVVRRVYLGNKNFSTTEPPLKSGDATVVGWVDDEIFIADTTAANLDFAVGVQQPFVFDFTDGAGHGLLYANQNLYIQLVSGGTGIVNTARVKMLYREKYITEPELLGLVLQSNQN